MLDASLILQLMLVFETSEIIKLLQRIVEQEDVNWESLLSFTAAFLVYFSQAPKQLNGMWMFHMVVSNIKDQMMSHFFCFSFLSFFFLRGGGFLYRNLNCLEYIRYFTLIFIRRIIICSSYGELHPQDQSRRMWTRRPDY